MKKFYLLYVLGIVFLVAGCGEKTDQATTVTSNDALATGKEITISLNGQATEVAPATTSVATTTTSVAPVAEMPMEAAPVAAEAPTNQQIQQALKNAGLYDGAIDGNIGKKSKAAIKAFQEQNGLTADGKVGKKTWAKLSTYLNAAPAVTVPAGQ